MATLLFFVFCFVFCMDFYFISADRRNLIPQLFSATQTSSVSDLARLSLQDPDSVSAGAGKVSHDSVPHPNILPVTPWWLDSRISACNAGQAAAGRCRVHSAAEVGCSLVVCALPCDQQDHRLSLLVQAGSLCMFDVSDELLPVRPAYSPPLPPPPVCLRLFNCHSSLTARFALSTRHFDACGPACRCWLCMESRSNTSVWPSTKTSARNRLLFVPTPSVPWNFRIVVLAAVIALSNCSPCCQTASFTLFFATPSPPPHPLVSFRSGYSPCNQQVLLATDIAQRGLDFPAVDWVVQVGLHLARVVALLLFMPIG